MDTLLNTDHQVRTVPDGLRIPCSQIFTFPRYRVVGSMEKVDFGYHRCDPFLLRFSVLSRSRPCLGAGASFVMMMLPPTSGRKAVRQRNAASITSLERLYGFLLSVWIDYSSSPTTTTRAPTPEPDANAASGVHNNSTPGV